MREVFESENHRLPSYDSTIQSMVMAYGASIQKKTIDELLALKKSQMRFTLTFDDPSLKNRRSLNLQYRWSCEPLELGVSKNYRYLICYSRS